MFKLGKYYLRCRRNSRFISFFDGMGSLNLWGGNFRYDKFSSPDEADYKAIKSDWDMVGSDMKNAINRYYTIKYK